MTDKLDLYRQAVPSTAKNNRLWPLYGAGLESMGQNGQPIDVPMPTCGPDQLLVRHDACGLCFSDIKVIAQGQNHPRIMKDMKIDPVVLGHEVSMTVIEVGEKLNGQYKVGDRLTLETDVFVNGVALAYGYMFQGGLSQYSALDPRIINSDYGNMLIPLRMDLGYAESALTEPWACVIAAYRLEYRNEIKPGGTLWIIGAGSDKPFTIQTGFDEKAHPNKLMLSNVPKPFEGWLKEKASVLGIEVFDVPDITVPPVEYSDDIVLLGENAELIEKVSSKLAQYGIMAIMGDTALPRKVSIDVGRVHYQRWTFVGSRGNDISAAYGSTPVRSNLLKGGSAWFVGAGGPMGRMHVQRAIQFIDAPSSIVCTDVSDMRLNDLYQTYAEEAKSRGINFICLNPTNKEEYAQGMAPFFKDGFNDIVVLVPVPPVITDASEHLARGGVMNIFAGVARGTQASLDLSDIYMRDTRVIGHSASLMSDMRMTLSKMDSGELLPNRSVAAVGSLSAARDGLQAVKDTTLAGKVVIYPNIKELPLTPLADLETKMPTVFARLKDGREWTNEAEEEFLSLMLP